MCHFLLKPAIKLLWNRVLFALALVLVFSGLQAQVGEIPLENDQGRAKIGHWNIVTRPSLGLVLSGGGAKGFAHIGAIKVFEEAGLQFDFIAGTSMGSVVGSLYALGYHPDTMRKIVSMQNWDAVMNDRIPRRFIPIEEKQNSDRFIITFPIVERKVKVRDALYTGQKVDLLLAQYLSPAYEITQFNKLPVPFICVATDLESGANVVLKSGPLHRAVKASMAIPGYFSPVNIDGQLLVDGGVINNYPVEEVKDAGAEIVIGVDVQTGLHPAENLNSMFTILDQVTSFYRMSANERALNLTDVYIRPNLRKFDMMSFNDYNEIINRGEEAARVFLPQLKRLADTLQSISPRKARELNAQPLDSIFITYVQYNGLKRVSKEFVDGALGIVPRTWINLNELTDRLKRAYGSGFFELINYYFVPVEEGAGIVINIREASSGFFGAGVHYDSDYKAALLLNATFKNVAIKGSKLFMDLNLGENPRLQGLYLVDRGAKVGFGVRASAYRLNLNQYSNNKIVNVLRFNQNMAEVFAQWTIDNVVRFRTGLSYESIKIRRSITDTTDAGFQPYLISFAEWSVDTYDKNQFPTRGSQVQIVLKNITSLGSQQPETITKNALMASGYYQTNIPIERRHTFKTGVSAGFTIRGHQPPAQHVFIVGGQSRNNYFSTLVPFTGLRFIEYFGLYHLNVHLAWQYNFAPNFYITPKWDLGYVTETFDELLMGPKLLSGFGAAIGYESIIGPFELSLMGSNVTSGTSTFINIGYWF